MIWKLFPLRCSAELVDSSAVDLSKSLRLLYASCVKPSSSTSSLRSPERRTIPSRNLRQNSVPLRCLVEQSHPQAISQICRRSPTACRPSSPTSRSGLLIIRSGGLGNILETSWLRECSVEDRVSIGGADESGVKCPSWRTQSAGSTKTMCSQARFELSGYCAWLRWYKYRRVSMWSGRRC